MYFLCYEVLKIINFYELADQGASYELLVGGCMAFNVLQTVIFFLDIYGIRTKKQGIYLYLTRLVDILFIIQVKVLSGPMLGLIVNTILCDPNGSSGLVCYSVAHIICCVIAVNLFISIVFQILTFSLLYYSKNPFHDSYNGVPTRNYMLTKGLFKLLFPIYFALSSTLNLDFLYIVAAPAMWGLYIFFHRLNSLHSFSHCHFYSEFFFESFLFVFALCGLLSYYVDGAPNSEPWTLVYVLIASLFGGYALDSFERTLHRRFMKECLAGKIRKQNMDRFVLDLINLLIHMPLEKRNVWFRLYLYALEPEKKENLRSTYDIKECADNNE
jgi:hypothetical protein